MAKKMRERGFDVGRRRAGVLMRQFGLQAAPKLRYRPTTDSRHSMRVMPNAPGGSFAAGEPKRVWAGDITCLWTREGWLHLAALMDLHSRRVVGWAMDRTMKADLVKAALAMAIGRRRPGPGLIHHSDRGSQYASEAHRRELARDGMERDMSRKGDCWDNAVAERFSPKLERRMHKPQTAPRPKRGQTGHRQLHRDVL